MTNKEIITMDSGLQSLRKGDTKRFPARVAFAIVRNIKRISPIIEDIQITLSGILQKYGELSSDNPNYYIIKSEYQGIASKEFSELDEVENDITFYPISFSDLEGIDLSIQEMEALYPMIEEEK